MRASGGNSCILLKKKKNRKKIFALYSQEFKMLSTFAQENLLWQGVRKLKKKKKFKCKLASRAARRSHHSNTNIAWNPTDSPQRWNSSAFTPASASKTDDVPRRHLHASPPGSSLHHREAGQSAHTLAGLSLLPWRHCLKRSVLCIVGRRHDNHRENNNNNDDDGGGESRALVQRETTGLSDIRAGEHKIQMSDTEN